MQFLRSFKFDRRWSYGCLGSKISSPFIALSVKQTYEIGAHTHRPYAFNRSPSPISRFFGLLKKFHTRQGEKISRPRFVPKKFIQLSGYILVISTTRPNPTRSDKLLHWLTCHHSKQLPWRNLFACIVCTKAATNIWWLIY